MMPVRELLGLERLRAARQVERWGYPRAVEPAELLLGHWFGFGPDGIFWLVGDGSTELGESKVHIATAPGSRMTRAEVATDWQRSVLVIAQLLGAVRLVADPKPGSAQARVLGPVLSRLGWTRRGARWYLSALGGDPWGAVRSRERRSGGKASRRSRAGRARARSS